MDLAGFEVGQPSLGCGELLFESCPSLLAGGRGGRWLRQRAAQQGDVQASCSACRYTVSAAANRLSVVSVADPVVVPTEAADRVVACSVAGGRAGT